MFGWRIRTPPNTVDPLARTIGIGPIEWNNANVTHGRRDDDGKSEDQPSLAIAEFASRLRQLRTDAGAPSFRHLARLTHYSASTLAEATAGRRLPTEAVLTAFVRACGADPVPWLADLARITRNAAKITNPDGEAPTGPVQSLALIPPKPPAGSTTAPMDPAERTRHGHRRRVTLALVVMLFVGTAAGLGVGRLVPEKSTARAVHTPTPVASVPTAVPTARVADGADPAAAHCGPDAQLVDKMPVMLHGVQIGALELKYSPFCGAGWARAYLYPGQPTMLGWVEVESSDDRSAAFENPLIKQNPIYTNVIVTGDGGCLGARAVFYDPGQLPVNTSIRCQTPIT